MNSTPDSGWYSAPEVVPEADLQYIDKQEPTPPYPDDGYISKVHKNRIWGLKARSFWILFSIITAVVVISAAVGGGIGGSMAARSQKSKDSSSTTIAQPSNDTVTSASSSSASNTNNNPTPTSSKLITVTTTEVIGPSQTLFRDCPSSNGTLYDVTLGPRVYSFRKFCNTVLVTIGANVVSTLTNDLNTCIDRCAGYNFHNNSTGCNSVCLWNTIDSPEPGTCWGFPTQNSSSEFQFEIQAICDSAGLINML